MDAVAAGFRRKDFPKAEISSSRNSISLRNGIISLTWRIQKGSIFPESACDCVSGGNLSFGKSEIFEFQAACSPDPEPVIVKSGEMGGAESLITGSLRPAAEGVRLSESVPGKHISAEFFSPRTGIAVKWSAVLRDGSNYIRQFFELSSRDEAAEITRLVLWNIPAPGGAKTIGANEGSPVVYENCFFGFEHCMAANRTARDPDGTERIECGFNYAIPLWQDHPVEYSSVFGVASRGNIRRSFLYYLERERANPYRQILNHNNTEGIGYDYWRLVRENRVSEASRLRKKQPGIWKKLIETFGEELVKKRGAAIASFCHDHGWDDENLVWQFHEGFPAGFAEAHETASRYGAGLGAWLSPMGGYYAKKARMEAGRKKHGFEIRQDSNFDIAGKRYKTRFYLSCLNMIRMYNANYFKFDGFGGGGNDRLGCDGLPSVTESVIEVIDRLRLHKPDVFLSPTVGAWQSPFWLLHADATWRPGADYGTCGRGTPRQKWITYRDASVYRIVKYHSPLYPISSLMLHGIQIRKDHESKFNFDRKDIIDEIRSFFATGVNLQELYINPGLMEKETWDTLAEAAIWSRGNEDIMADTHWIGGDPERGEIYGWASYGYGRGVLGLRNPDEKARTLELDIREAFELPEGAHLRYSLKSPWKEDEALPPIKAEAGKITRFELEPFQVLVFNAVKA